MIRHTIIINPEAGQGKGAHLMPLVERAFHSRNLPFTALLTDRPGHATELAKAAPDGIVVGVGGDGTLNEIANGIIGTEKVLGIVPAGSGNDFRKSLGIPRSVEGALEVLFSERVRTVDAGVVMTSKATDQPGSSRHFINGVGVGFDAAVAAKTREIRFLTGLPLYLAAVFRTLGRFRAPEFRARLDGQEEIRRRLLVAIGNGKCAGGGFYLTPDARVDDGLLDICLIDAVSTPVILTLMPLVLIGKHGRSNAVTFKKGRRLTLSSSDEFYVHADGEMVGRQVSRVEVEILPGALKAVCGAEL